MELILTSGSSPLGLQLINAVIQQVKYTHHHDEDE